MIEQVIEGKWDELIQREDLRGHRVRVTVIDAAQSPLTPESSQAERQAWFERLMAWAQSHEPVKHFVDDSRESIYDGTIDNPR